MNEKCLYLIDGHALVYRSYYAFIRNPLTNSRGQPTGALYGFANYLIRLIENYSCPYMAVVMDSSAPTFRHDLYEEYKANREAMPDDLKAQMPVISELIAALNLPLVKKEGLEADDLIAILTNHAVAEGFEVFLVTKDKDLMQLVGPQVKMLAPEGTGVFTEYGPQEVFSKMGLEPARIVDYLALIGDASDNIPGVPGVGPKTALKILEKVKSVDDILQDPSVLEKPKLIEKFTEHRERLKISKILATLKTDVEIEFKPEHLKRAEVNKNRCVSLFRDNDFTSLVKNPLFGGTEKLKPELKIVKSLEELETIKSKIVQNGYLAIDTQTTGLLPRAAKLVGISLALDPEQAYYIPVGHSEGGNVDLVAALESLKEIIESAAIGKIGQNLKYDYQIFRNYGLTLKGIHFDSMIAAYLIEPGKRNYDLGMISPQWLDLEVTPIEKVLGNGKNALSADFVSVEQLAPYAAEVVCLPLLVKEELEPLLEERNCRGLFRDVELPLSDVLAEMEWRGIQIDTSLLSTLSKQYCENLDSISQEIFNIAGESFNLNSPKQVGEVLFGKLGIKGGKKTKGGAQSTGVEVLERLSEEYPVVQMILDHREKQKLLSTYIDALPSQVYSESGRVHSSFNQAVTATGRLSSTNPNLQNIPIRTENGRKIREAFVAGEGSMLVAADYSQIELRILAHLSEDPMLIEAFENDEDIHTLTASVIFTSHPQLVTPEMRRVAKTINFGLMYGMGPINLSRQLKISFGEAKKFIETYFTQFPTIRSFMDCTIENARSLGYTETLFGRRRYLPEINASNKNIKVAAERTAINTPVQGTAADIIKMAMVNIHKNLNSWSGAHMLLQVHDELVFEVPREKTEEFAAWVTAQMSDAFKLKVPLKVEAGFGTHWGKAH
ncbi:DNA polymerase I [Chitinispirillales bacterium ANBcel5]|uniref:DNA polymerase I n=1 Tax=Cellulosispirillum alkaliphilum TaxID=3039283 RepID=UPI002A51FAF2|nr:DNA polymerase I [Chitinispirillales bacterium ANBcel5]